MVPFASTLSSRCIASSAFGDCSSQATEHVLLNNSELGKISKEQRAGEWPVWETNLHNPSFAAFAKLCGGHGARVTKADQIEAAIQEALADGGPALVEIITDAELV